MGCQHQSCYLWFGKLCFSCFDGFKADSQDADLIMLALATHEPNFRVLREDVFAQGSTGPRVCKKCGVEGHVVANCKGQSFLARIHLQLTFQAKPRQKTPMSSKRPNQSTRNHSFSSTCPSSENI
jgi:hypothetical protein